MINTRKSPNQRVKSLNMWNSKMCSLVNEHATENRRSVCVGANIQTSKDDYVTYLHLYNAIQPIVSNTAFPKQGSRSRSQLTSG